MQKEDFIKVLEKIADGSATDQEIGLYLHWYQSFEDSPELWKDLKDRPEVFKQELYLKIKANTSGIEEVSERAEEISKSTGRIFKLWPRIAAASRIAIAAAVLLVIGAGLFFYNRFASAPRHPELVSGSPTYANDIKPGGNKAYLILANGKRLSLTDAANGAIAKEAGVEITKTADGQVVYKTASDISGRQDDALNTIETPRGGQYQIQLPDGSKVWLNAASKLIYPVSFTGRGQRKVELYGEAYFEIFKNKLQPFVVKSKNQEVTVLGTHFNVYSYTDESSVKTTLLEGIVRISALRYPEPVMPAKAGTGPQNSKGGGPDLHQDDVGERNGIILKPGEQATLQSNHIKVTAVNAEESIAWKNGKFVFANETLDAVMRKLSRWYDVEVVYNDVFPDNNFTGSMSRFENIAQVLRKIELTNKVHFKIEGKRIIVTK